MKKKFVLSVAIILIVVAACVSLVGCTSSTPTDFMSKWFSAEKKTFCTYKEDGSETISTEYIFDGSIIKMTNVRTIVDEEGNKSTSTSIKIIEKSGKTVNTYYGNQEEENEMQWAVEVTEYATEKDVPKQVKTFYESLSERNYQYVTIVSFEKKDFENNFTKKDDWYRANNPLMYEFYGIKIDKEALLIKDDVDSDVAFNAKYVIGCDTISIPAEAKKALDDYKESISNN